MYFLLFTLIITHIFAVDIIELNSMTRNQKLQAQVCSGIMNRAEEKSVYIIQKENDVEWYQDLYGDIPNVTSYESLLQKCLPQLDGKIEFNYTKHQGYLPNIITISSVENLLPVDIEEVNQFNNLRTVVDIETYFPTMTYAEATQKTHCEYINQTSGLAFRNLGWDVHEHKWRPRLIPRPGENYGFIDYIIKEKLFTIFLIDACIPFTKEHTVMENIVQHNPWETPIKVYGYNDAWAIAGDLFEASTSCVRERNMGSVPTTSARNMAFFSSGKELRQRQQYRPENLPTHNPNHTYVAYVIGDADNLGFDMVDLQRQIKKHNLLCNSGICPSIIWSISPHLNYLAPDIANWLFDNLKNDSFILPPSGYLYSYPTQMPAKVQDTYVKLTEEICLLYDCASTISWDFFGWWNKAINSFLPKYSLNKIIKAVFALNVPYFFPILPLRDRYIEIDGIYVYNPQLIIYEATRTFNTVDVVASKINSWEKGSINYIFVAANLDIEFLHNVTMKLHSNVKILDQYSFIQVTKTAI